MINSLYLFINKGSFRTLSFILALGLTIAFFFNLDDFSTALRSAPFIWVFTVLWGVVTLWIHGIGFEIRHIVWRVIFFPYIGYITALSATINHFL
ncbi:cyd operon protein YbgE [Rodentibacter caecimuris]|uniref:Cyd operon protein YbgE n=1 Tax=Rodentibacter caecimuris TaxID=1796644 RepID=A0ABX3KXP6_9PAST|nr:cyd operon protein YbgE [Rodentibacter heylii]